MKFSVILTDLDGTLFRNDKSISDYSKKMIAQAQQKGLLFGICTARAKINALKFLDGIKPDILISNGGGLVTLKDEVIYSCQFSVEEARTLINTAFEVFGPDVILSADNEHGLYSNSKEELGDKFWTFDDFRDFKEPCMKMCIESLDRQKIEKIVSSIGLDKSHLKIGPEQIVAFGDDFNDIGMLKLCGKGIAMKNAITEVQAVADEVCLSNEEDGVARWMEAHL